jgi:hypothetical protein
MLLFIAVWPEAAKVLERRTWSIGTIGRDCAELLGAGSEKGVLFERPRRIIVIKKFSLFTMNETIGSFRIWGTTLALFWAVTFRN